MQVTHSVNAVWDVTLALRAVQLGLGYRAGTVGARFQCSSISLLSGFLCMHEGEWLNMKLKHKIVTSSCA